MTKIEIDLHDDAVSVLNKLKNINDAGIELVVPEGAVLFENILNLKLIKNWSDRENKVVNFATDDEGGLNLLMSMDEDNNPSSELPSDLKEDEDITAIDENVTREKFKMPKFSISLGNLKSKGLLILVIILILLGLGSVFAYNKAATTPIAYIRIVVNSQPLTRSIEMKVAAGEETDQENKILSGATVEVSLDDKITIETTGEKIVGEYAEGEITIFNKTDEEKEFKEGTDITYKDDDDKERVYELKDDVTVPAREETPGENPGDPGTFVNGSADVDVVAKEFGNKHNIDEGEDLEVEDQDDSDFVAEVKKDIDGGSEETVKTVSQEDLDKLQADLLENAEEKAIRELTSKIDKEQKLVNGSQTVTTTKESFSHALDDETDEVTLEQTFVAKGLVYEPEELDKLIDKIVEDFVPDGFVLSTEERSVNVEILGNTETTILNETEADLQVTLKTFVVPEISEESIKNDLAGQTIGDAQKILGSIRNVNTYELNLSPRIPLFDNIPTDHERINIDLERE